MQIVNLPVSVLLNLKVPDRDIYRYFVIKGFATAIEIREKFNISTSGTYNVLGRLSRLGLIKARPLTNRRNKWHIVINPKAKCRVDKTGRVVQLRTKR